MPDVAQRRAVRFEPPLMRLPVSQIGGGRVVRPFNMEGKRVMAGTILSREQIINMNAANRRELLDRFISVWPIAGGDVASAATVGSEGRAERYVVPLGFGSYHVVEGKLVTKEPLSDRAEAYKLAGKPMPVKAPPKHKEH